MRSRLLCLTAMLAASPAAAFGPDDHPCSQPEVTAEVVRLMHQRFGSASGGELIFDMAATTLSVDDIRTSIVSSNEADCKATLIYHLALTPAGQSMSQPGFLSKDQLNGQSELPYTVELTDQGKLLVTVGNAE